MDPELALWCFDTGAVDQRAAHAALSEDERGRAARLPEGLREAFVATRASLRRILAEFGIDPAIAFRYGAFGKPTLPYDARLWFNVSHAGAWCAIAVSREAETGVDIESVDSDVALDPLFERFFATRERAELRGRGELDPRAFFETWTRREAVLKTVGLGLGPAADAFAVTVPPAPPALLEAGDARFAGPFSFHRFEPTPAIVGTAVVAAPRARLSRRSS